MQKILPPASDDQGPVNPAVDPSAVAANERATPLLDHDLIDELRYISRANGRDGMFSEMVSTLEGNLAGFGAAFSEYIDRGDAARAVRAAHTLRGACHQIGARVLGELFADIERSANVGDYAEAKRRFNRGAGLVAQSLEALKHV